MIILLFLAILAFGAGIFVHGILERRKLARRSEIPWSKARLREFMETYRALGFFADVSDPPSEQQFTELLALTNGLPGDPREDWRDDLLALQFLDPDRVWWEDLEADVCDGNEVYAEVLVEWAFISRGAFRPAAITEKWETEKGPVEVSFQIDGIAHTLRPVVNDDWLDLSILDAISAALPDRSRQFEVVAQEDQTAAVLFLSQEEKQGLERLGWKFF